MANLLLVQEGMMKAGMRWPEGLEIADLARGREPAHLRLLERLRKGLKEKRRKEDIRREEKRQQESEGEEDLEAVQTLERATAVIDKMKKQIDKRLEWQNTLRADEEEVREERNFYLRKLERLKSAAEKGPSSKLKEAVLQAINQRPSDF